MSPGSRSHDREWLGYDADVANGDADAATDANGAAAPPDPSAQGPWLRHDLADDASAGGADAATGVGPDRDPVWLAPELDVPSPGASAGEAHDTGVPPTIAEEPASGSIAGSTSGSTSRTAGGAAYDELPAATNEPVVVPEAAAEDTSPRAEGTDETADEVADEGDRAGTDAGTADKAPEEEEAGLLAVVVAAVKEFAIVVGMALVLSFIVKTWLLQAFYIPSGSMEDTLVLNDRVIVSKLTPGPVDLKRGDIIVFADPGEWLEETPQVPHGKVVTVVRETMTFVGLLPDNSENHLIKRVIGLPGDHVVCCDEGGRITVNGTAIKEPYLKPGDSASDQDFDITVPRGRVWVMGDHRSNSADSRAHDAPDNDGSRGSVDERLIVGRAVALVWPLDHLTWLSNPTATFSDVPAPRPEEVPTPTKVPQGDPGSQTGGVEVTGDGGEGGG